MRILLSLLLALVATGFAYGQEPDLLPPEQAFRFEVSAGQDVITVEWDAADGYYLYRKRFGFQSQTPGLSLGEPRFPEGETHEDEFFGRMEIYRGQFSIDIPVTRSTTAGESLQLEIRSQGCADIGLCYPPQTWTREVILPPAEPSGKQDLLSLIAAPGGGEEFLPPDEAFRFSAEAVNRGWIELNWQIADGYYLYRHSLEFLTLDEAQSIGEPLIPEGKRKQDEFFGEVEVYYRELSIRLPVALAGKPSLELQVGYQGCAEDGICYPPIKRDVSLRMDNLPVADPAPAASAPVSEQDRLATLIRDGALPWVVAMFFGFGLLLAFTPCVLPMVPILSSIIVGHGSSMSTRRAFSLSLVFVLAMSLTYTVAGVAAALLGQNLQAAFQHPLILIGFSAVFVVLALAMFDVYELQMPAAIQTRLTETSQKQAGGTLVGAGVMGFLSALIVGPCVAAPLAAALIVIGQSGDAVRGGSALFALSLGMGMPLLAFGASAGKLLPKAGAWMEAVKKFFGLLLLGVAIWMLERIIPPAATLALWGLLLLMSGIFMGALDSLQPGAATGRRLGKGLGLVALLYGVLLLVGAASGGSDPFRPLQGLIGEQSQTQSLKFTYVKSNSDLDRQLAAAASNGQLAMLDFYADWCVDCKKMERYTFVEPAVIASLEGMVLLKADVTANDDPDKKLLQRFGIFGPPTIAFFGPDGREVRAFRQVGFASAEEFSAHVDRFVEQAGQ
jgi:thiol:disulfide interchange protein DsbD